MYSRLKPIDDFFMPVKPEVNSQGEYVSTKDNYPGLIQMIVGHSGTVHYFVGPSAEEHITLPFTENVRKSKNSNFVLKLKIR